MTILIDLIGSWFIRAMLVAVMLTLSVNMNNALYTSTQKASAKAHMAVVYSVLYADLNRVGTGTSVPNPPIALADASNLRFYADTNASGTTAYETILLQSVYNPTTKLYALNRKVNSGSTLVLGREFKSVAFKYYDARGTEIASPWDYSKIRQIRVQLQKRVDGITTADSTISTNVIVYPPNLYVL